MQAGRTTTRPRAAGRSPPISAGPARSGAAGWVAWSLWGLTVGLLAAGVVLEARNSGEAELWEQSLSLAPMALSFATVGALIGSRRPGNPIGWLCLASGVVGRRAAVRLAVCGLCAGDRPGGAAGG